MKTYDITQPTIRDRDLFEWILANMLAEAGNYEDYPVEGGLDVELIINGVEVDSVQMFTTFYNNVNKRVNERVDAELENRHEALKDEYLKRVYNAIEKAEEELDDAMSDLRAGIRRSIFERGDWNADITLND